MLLIVIKIRFQLIYVHLLASILKIYSFQADFIYKKTDGEACRNYSSRRPRVFVDFGFAI